MFDELGKGYFSFGLPVGSGKVSDTTLGNKSLRVLGTTAGFVTRIVQTPEGRMRVRTKNGMPEFLMENFSDGTEYSQPPKKQPIIFYMSSGAYDTGSYNLSNHALTSNFTLYKSSTVQTADTASFDTTLMPIARPLTGELSKLYTQAVMGADTLTMASLAVSVTNPSQFTGLARRLMQGRYGCGNYSPQIGGLMMNNHFGDTCGLLYFSEPNEYWLVRLLQETSDLVITGYKLTLHADLKPLLDAARALDPNSTQTAALETLALGWAKNLQQTETTIATFTGMPDGEPVAHSWNFSLRTNKADCVLRAWGGYLYDRHWYRHMRITFGYDSINQHPSALLTTEETVDGSMYCAKSPIWVPLGNSTIWLNNFPTSPEPATTQNCPVYAYYKDDVLDVIRWRYSKTDYGAYSSYARDMIQEEAETATSLYGPGSFNYAWDYYYGLVEEYGFEGLFDNCKAKSAQSVEFRQGTYSVEYQSGPPTGPDNPPNVGFRTDAAANFHFSGSTDTDVNPRIANYPTPAFAQGLYYTIGPGSHYSHSKTTTGITTNEWVGGTKSYAHISALVFSINDPCTVYFGKSVVKSGTHYDVYGRRLGTIRVDEWYVDGNNNNILGVWHPPVYRQLNPYDEGRFTGYITSPNDRFNVVVDPIYERSIKVTCKGTVVSLWGADSLIFHAGAGNTPLPLPIRAISSSVFNDGRFTSGNLQQDVHMTLNGYPVTIDAFVGVS